MFAWFREQLQDYRTWRRHTTYTMRVLNQCIIESQREIRTLKERLDTLEKVQRTLCDDIYDLQADMTLIHNIEGYEDWREEIGKPVSKPTDIVK